MTLLTNLQLMSRYNQWMNQKVYSAATELGDEKIKQDRGAFFGSILGTLNHIYVADIIWLRRFAQHPKRYSSLSNLPELSSYTQLNLAVFETIDNLETARQELDRAIIDWCAEIEPADLETWLSYSDTKNNPYCKNFGQLIHNWFNHQTHHRGQISTLINQEGVDIGVTDLLVMLPNRQ